MFSHYLFSSLTFFFVVYIVLFFIKNNPNKRTFLKCQFSHTKNNFCNPVSAQFIGHYLVNTIFNNTSQRFYCHF